MSTGVPPFKETDMVSIVAEYVGYCGEDRAITNSNIDSVELIEVLAGGINGRKVGPLSSNVSMPFACARLMGMGTFGA
jgi:hypothetical protein